MTTLSKCDFEEALMKHSCKDLFHPWSESCVTGSLVLGASAILGGLKFFTVMYGVHIIFKMKSKKKIDYMKEIKGFTRSLTFVTLFGSIFGGVNCLCREAFGKYNYYVVTCVIPLLCGTGVFLESRERKMLNATTFLTGAFEGYYRHLQGKGILRSSRLVETIIFMLLNGALMYSLRAQRGLNDKGDSPWFFVPLKIKCDGEERECSHEGTCSKSLRKDLTKFGGITVLIALLKLLVINFRKPSGILEQLLTWRTWKLPSFVCAYIGIFKVVSCYLCKTGGDSLQNTFIAGLLGGLSYAVSPNITVLFSVLTALVKIMSVRAKKKYGLPTLPYLELTFIMSNLFTLYLRAFDRHNCPKYVYNMLNIITLNKSEMINDAFYKALHDS